MVERLEQDAIARLVGNVAKTRLGDPRRTARAMQIMERLAQSPRDSLPNVLSTPAELEGAYRFFNNENISFADLLEPHAEAVVGRVTDSGVVLAIHDTTTAQFAHADPNVIGFLPTGKAGFLLHLTLVVDIKDWRRPLGVVYAEALTRDTPPRKPGKNRRRASGSETSRRTSRESERWLRGVQSTAQRFEGKASIIHVADREADKYPLLHTLISTKQRFVIRAAHDRLVDVDGMRLHVREVVDAEIPVLEREVPLTRRLAKRTAPAARRKHPPREGRIAPRGTPKTGQ
jgi:hypothetical protein